MLVCPHEQQFRILAICMCKVACVVRVPPASRIYRLPKHVETPEVRITDSTAQRKDDQHTGVKVTLDNTLALPSSKVSCRRYMTCPKSIITGASLMMRWRPSFVQERKLSGAFERYMDSVVGRYTYLFLVDEMPRARLLPEQIREDLLAEKVACTFHSCLCSLYYVPCQCCKCCKASRSELRVAY
jgi:hypothetical protein